MTDRSAHWRNVQNLFDQLIDQPAEGRSSAIRELCDPDPELQRELTDLLAAFDEAGDFMEAPPGVEMQAIARSESAPTRCGAYRILQPLGQGGSGTVYLAQRDDNAYRRQVAIKVIRRERADRDLLQRFLTERQILASLDHPNIAGLFDGGSTEDGLPYLVMEYIEGLPIDEFCNARRLRVADRLRLFQTVCDAVAHAHRNQVIHRDIKPSNVLITNDGVPKLLDFGIAKLLRHEGSPWKDAATTTRYRPLTPRYASPEQLRGEATSTRSDVYSLGVLLHQLLTGQLPQNPTGPGEGTTPFQTLGNVHPPSRVIDLSKNGVDPDPLPGRSAKKLKSRLRGDLDTIVLAALESEPERRYATAGGLSEDFRRHLAGLPILARPASRTYRLGKWAKRHPKILPLAILSSVLVAVLITLLSQQSQRLEQERAQARLERDRSSQVLELTQEVFSQTDPFHSGDHEPTAGEILENASSRIAELNDQPAAQAALMTTLGDVYLERGEYSKAEALLAGALRIRREFSLDQSVETTENMGSLGITLNRLGRYEEAEALQLETLALRQKVFGTESREVAWSYNDLGVLMRRVGRQATAERFFRLALTQYRSLLDGEDHEEIATGLNNLGLILGDQNKLDEAERVHRAALEIRQRVLGSDHLYTAYSRVTLSHTLLLKGDWRAAEPLLDRGSSQLLDALGEDHPQVLRTQIIRGLLWKWKGDYAEAERHLREALLRIGQSPNGGRSIASIFKQLAEIREHLGDPQEAEQFARQALATFEKHFGADHPATSASREKLEQILSK